MENQNIEQEVMLTKEDFASDQVVKWCPGCGDHAILKAVQDIFPKLGKKKEDIVVVSGIGCSSRFPYYMNTYGFHSIHGRAAAAATGVKLANPNLSVWMITGDGDCTAIGGNHFIHACRRNIDINLILFNNRIYGMTKGQFSPCTFRGTKTKTSPQGTYEDPFNPGRTRHRCQGYLLCPWRGYQPQGAERNLLGVVQARRHRRDRGPAKLHDLLQRRARKHHRQGCPRRHAGEVRPRPTAHLR